MSWAAKSCKVEATSNIKKDPLKQIGKIELGSPETIGIFWQT
jgi:hypothetical protein